MLPYWLLFLVPAVAVFWPGRFDERAQRLLWLGTGLLFTLMIGLRHQVGGDWGSYLGYLERASFMSLPEVLAAGDPGYYFVNWVAAQLGGDIYWVNLFCGAVVMAGVVTFARRQPLPWLALLVAVPYLIMVVAMGYTRQATALGFAMLGLAALEQERTRTFVIWVVIGALFHKTAVLLLPIAAMASSGNRLWTGFWVGVTAVTAAALLLLDSSAQLWENYVEADYQSQGGLIRVAMNALPALIFLMVHRYLDLSVAQRRLWFWMSLLAIACIPLVLISSTAVDRMALYLIPIQMFVFARLFQVFADPVFRGAVVAGVVGYYAAVQLVWLTMATHAFAWLPYQFAPLV